jgi:hypothetical protein
MDKKSTENTDIDCIDAAEDLVSDLLDSGRSVPEISFALASVATDLSLQNASTAMHALTIVTSAVSKTLAAHAAVHDNQNPKESLSADSDELSIINTEVFGRSVH